MTASTDAIGAAPATRGTQQRWQPPIRPELAGERPYGAPQLAVPVVLNVNENPFAPSAQVCADIARAVSEAARNLNRYPDRDARILRTELADYLNQMGAPGLTGDHVWAANGSNEVMVQLLQAFAGPDRSMLIFPPSYSMYPEYARLTHTQLVTCPRRANFSLDLPLALDLIAQQRPEVVVVAAPNNPTGTPLSAAELSALLAAAPGLVVVDEAYAEFARDQRTPALTMLAEHPQLVVVRTMSKAFALAGARLGYVAADRRVIEALMIVRLPYHLSAITQTVALRALAHRDELLAEIDVLRSERDQQATWLAQQGFEVAATDANFVLFGKFADRGAIWQALLDRGVLIRNTGPEGWLRVSIGTPAENAAFRAALEEITA